jgi:RHH-type transcriptional regulator, rel operon repressor / antitoxin RelB
MTVAIHLPRDTEQRLDLLAVKTGRTKTDYLQEFIEKGLDEAEDYYLAAAVLERVRKGQEAVHSAADVRRDLGLDD